MDKAERNQGVAARICDVPGCERKQHCRGICSMHWSRKQKYGHVGSAEPQRQMHGMTGHPLHDIWKGIMRRCLEPRDRAYPRYGGRGITIAERWREFPVFAEDVLSTIGKRPDGTSLDRIDNDKGYEPGNVRWATATVQNRNARSNKLSMETAREIRREYTTGNVSQSELGRRYGIRQTMVSRIVRGERWKDSARPADEVRRALVGGAS